MAQGIKEGKWPAPVILDCTYLCSVCFIFLNVKYIFYEEKCIYLPYKNTWVKLGLASGDGHVHHT